MLLRSDAHYTSYNDINAEYIFAPLGCIKVNPTNKSIVGNRIAFGYLEADADHNCVDCTGEIFEREVWMGNNNYIGGRLVNGNWGFYNLNGHDTLTTPQFEGVKNGLYYCGIGFARVIAPRYAELCFGAINHNAEGRPKIEGRGTLFKIAYPESYREDSSKNWGVDMAPAAGRIMPVNIDLSDSPTEFGGMPISKNYPSAVPIRARLETRYTDAVTDEFYTFGKHIIIRNPIAPRKKTVVASDGGYAGDYTVTGVDDEFLLYYEYVISEAGCDYTLPPSYDLIGYSKFRINQQSGTSCIFRDWRGTVVFDGSRYGEGLYELQARLKDGAGADYYDNRNQVWDVYKIAAPVATV